MAVANFLTQPINMPVGVSSFEKIRKSVDYVEDYDEILCYGIAFYKKRCLVKKG